MKRLSSSVRQESQEIATKRSVWIGMISVVVAVVAVGGSAALWYGSEEHGWSRPLEPNFAEIPLERSQIDRHARGLLLKEKDRDTLRSWAWVDEQKGIVAVPIDDAIQWFIVSEGSAAPASPSKPVEGQSSPNRFKKAQEAP